MTICLRCHRPLSKPTESGLGPVCAKLALPAPEVGRDLFGYDIEAAALAARARLAEFIGGKAWIAKITIRRDFRLARERLGARP